MLLIRLIEADLSQLDVGPSSRQRGVVPLHVLALGVAHEPCQFALQIGTTSLGVGAHVCDVLARLREATNSAQPLLLELVGACFCFFNGECFSHIHMYADGILVKEGDKVTGGQQIAKVGSSGQSDGCHLHFETHVNGEAVDPEPFMAEVGITLG